MNSTVSPRHQDFDSRLMLCGPRQTRDRFRTTQYPRLIFAIFSNWGGVLVFCQRVLCWSLYESKRTLRDLANGKPEQSSLDRTSSKVTILYRSVQAISWSVRLFPTPNTYLSPKLYHLFHRNGGQSLMPLRPGAVRPGKTYYQCSKLRG